MTWELIEYKEDKKWFMRKRWHIFHGYGGGAYSYGHDGAHGGAPSRAFPQGALAAKATEDKDARPSSAPSAGRFSWPC